MEVVDELIDIIIQDEYEDECSENIDIYSQYYSSCIKKQRHCYTTILLVAYGNC